MRLSFLFNGHRWVLRTVRRIIHGGEQKGGMCNIRLRDIRIIQSAKGEDFCRILLHELLHAQGWHIDEEFVHRASTEMAAVIYTPEVMERLTWDVAKDTPRQKTKR